MQRRARISLMVGVLAAASIIVAERMNRREAHFDAGSAVRGERLFQENCAICHGVRADGHGIRSAGLSPAPPDFTNAEWQVTHSAERVRTSIRSGVQGTQMPSWAVLGERSISDLTAFVKSRDPGK